MNNKLHVL